MSWMGLEAEEYDRKYSDQELFKRILNIFGKHRKIMIGVILMVTVSSIFSAVIPYLSSRLIESLEQNRTTTQLVILITVTFILNLSDWIMNVIYRIRSARVINQVVFDLREEVNNSVLNQDMSFFDKYPTGKIVSRVNSDSNNFGEMTNLFMQSLSSLFFIIIIIVPLAITNPTLTGIFVLMIPIIFVATLLFRKVARQKTLLGQRSLARVNAFVQESISGIQIAKTFRQESKLYDDFIEVNNQSYKVNLNRAIYLNVLFPMLGVIQSIILAVIIYYGGDLVLNSQISAADLYLFIQSLWLLFFPLFSIASFWPQFQTGLAAAERIFALIDSESKIQQNDTIKLDKIQGKIEFKNLNFRYTSDRPIYENFSLTITPGESVAIVGHTGAGKSTLARLILRLYEFQEGEILIDDHNIKDLDLEALRSAIGFIPQVPFLWSGTLEENIKYGKEDATEEEIVWALENSGGSDWINELPNGLNTDIRERGKMLSMGQRQLVVFARVLLENPSILILDEATASVDPFTEIQIQDAMEKLMKNRTSIIIAHHLWTVRHVDRIIVIDHGQIVEEGNHDELIAKKGQYAKLYNTYFRHQSYEFIEEQALKRK